MSETTHDIHPDLPPFDWSGGKRTLNPLTLALTGMVDEMSGPRLTVGGNITAMSHVEAATLAQQFQIPHTDLGKHGIQLSSNLQRKLAAKIIYNSINTEELAGLLLGYSAEQESVLILGALSGILASPRNAEIMLATALRSKFVSNVEPSIVDVDNRYEVTISMLRNGKAVTGQAIRNGKKNATRAAILNVAANIHEVDIHTLQKIDCSTPENPKNALNRYFQEHIKIASPSFNNTKHGEHLFSSEATCLIGDEERHFTTQAKGRKLADLQCANLILQAIAAHEAENGPEN